MADIHGLPFSPPPDFGIAEIMVTLRGPSVAGLKDPRALQPQRAIRPNLIVHQRALPAESTLDLLCGEMCAELLTSIEQLENLQTAPFPFADGADGRLVQFDFAAAKAMTVRQFQALRLDGNIFTTLTLTVSTTTLTDEVRDRLLASLASMGTPTAGVSA